MKWTIFCATLVIWNHIISGQDIVFPTEDDIPPISSSIGMVTERVPLDATGQCPENMYIYPGYGNKSAWICDCKPTFLYFPLNDSCYAAYRQGPCPPKNYVVLPKNEATPQCVKNPCSEDGLVQYNNECYPLRTIGGPCAPKGVLTINETTFEIECAPADVEQFIIVDPPPRRCPIGTRRNTLGICRDVLKP
ncbi:uncharacterized protein LOC117227852 [Megalopta genalis]|uniref:uncharacterized protein LOC117227852 n=1 Tax=Megalopta genalis TaxID=115081 RepID=UPI0014435ED9|nr:uncharacterized protein LOC117227852 [Megalopta genalis]XP_033339273.1 uncharacterized protein LOC117227852 [Megalopta genalis]XP_033339274.1 uncharacterized protein LOC117227853 [Megalopta genalis]